MRISPSRLTLGAFLLAFVIVGCDDGGLTAPDSAPTSGALAEVIDTHVETATADAMPSARAAAAEAGAGVTFISGPTTIDRSGFYFVTQDFSATTDGIVITANNVFLDLGGHTITGPDNKVGRGVAVEGARRVYVGGGTVQTFGVGVALGDAERVAVVGVRVLGGDEFADPPNGIAPQIGFLLVDSADNRIAGNSAIETNLGFFVRGGGSMDNTIQGNRAVAGDNGLLAICYNPADGTTSTAGPSRDLVRHNFLSGFGTGIQASEGSANNRFKGNRIYYLVDDYEDLNGSNAFVNNVTMQL